MSWSPVSLTTNHWRWQCGFPVCRASTRPETSFSRRCSPCAPGARKQRTGAPLAQIRVLERMRLLTTLSVTKSWVKLCSLSLLGCLKAVQSGCEGCFHYTVFAKIFSFLQVYAYLSVKCLFRTIIKIKLLIVLCSRHCSGFICLFS